jgi:hypothetical protein
MRGFQTASCARLDCEGHGFMRNLRDGFYRLGLPSGDPRVRQAPRLAKREMKSPGILTAG